jgi:hypothetical protein
VVLLLAEVVLLSRYGLRGSAIAGGDSEVMRTRQ